jgi:hypothetical protein
MNISKARISKKKKKEGNSDYFQKSPEENDKDLIHYVND